MRRLGPILLAFLPISGCLTDGRPNSVESAVRLPLRDKVAGQLLKLLNRDDWSGEVVDRRYAGRVSLDPADVWSEDVLVLDVLATDAYDDPVVVPPEDFATILGGLRRRIRDVVEDGGGEQVDWDIRDAFQERVLTFHYKSGNTAGAVVVRAFPIAGERPDEPLTRFEITIREKPQ
jgi:hypothetical protein